MAVALMGVFCLVAPAAAQVRGQNPRDVGVRGEGTRGLSGREGYPARPGRTKSDHVKTDQGAGTLPPGTPPRQVPGRWERWWDLNQDALLFERVGVTTPEGALSGAGVFGRGRSTGPFGGRPPGVEDEVVLALRERLDSGESDEVVQRVLIALARVADATRHPEVAAEFELALKNGAVSVKPLAALGLGVLGDRRAVPLLSALLRDDALGRDVVGRADVTTPVRSHAALALGLLGGPEVVGPLIEVARGAREADREVRACAAAALGVVGERATMRAAQGLLTVMLDASGDEPLVAACAALSLGKLGQSAVMPQLLSLAAGRDIDARLTTAAVTALGRLATLQDKTVMGVLEEAVEGGRLPEIRHAALMALARIGSRDQGSPNPPRRALSTLLRGATRNPEHDVDRPWGTLSFALFAREHEAERVRAIDVLMDQWRRRKAPSERSAIAMGLAVLRASKSAKGLLVELTEVSDELRRGYAALALGLLGEPGAEPALVGMLGAETTSDELRRFAARALGWLGTRGAAATLAVRVRSPQAGWPAAEALGRLRDAAVVPTLISSLDDAGSISHVRAMVAVALGFLAEKTVEPWQTRLLEDLDVIPDVLTFAALREM